MNKDFMWVIYGQLGTFMWHKKAGLKRVADVGGCMLAFSRRPLVLAN